MIDEGKDYYAGNIYSKVSYMYFLMVLDYYRAGYDITKYLNDYETSIADSDAK